VWLKGKVRGKVATVKEQTVQDQEKSGNTEL
jgi:hypothetical protein